MKKIHFTNRYDYFLSVPAVSTPPPTPPMNVGGVRPTHSWRGKWLSFIFLLLLSTLLSAQQIRLPDETIIGHVDITPDSLDLKVDISEYHGFANPERLAYKPILNKKLPGLDSHRYRFFTQLVGMGYMLTEDDWEFNTGVDFKFGIESLKIPELNIFGGYYYGDYGDGFKTQKLNANWEPMVNYGNLRIRPTIFIRNSIYEKDLQSPPIKYDSFEKSTLFSGGLALTAQPRNMKPLKEIRIAGEFFDPKYEQNEESEGEQVLEFDGTLAFSEMGFISDIELKTYQRFDNVHGEGNIFFQFPFLDLLGANLTYSENAYPSAYLSKNIKITANSEISIANLPYLDTKSIKYYHEYYPFISPETIEYAPQIPLNATLAFSLYSPIEVQLSYNMLFAENYIYLGMTYCENHLDYPCPKEYKWKQDQVMKNIITLDIRKYIDNFTIRLKSSYMLSEFVKENELDNLPYEAHFITSISGEYTWNQKMTFLLGGDLLKDRYAGMIVNNEQAILCDAFKLYSKIDFNINKNFKLFTTVSNYFTKKDEYYSRIEGLQKEELAVEAGVRVLF